MTVRNTLSPNFNRRHILSAGVGAAALVAAPPAAARVLTSISSVLKDHDPIKTELVMNLVVTCSSPERMGSSDNSKDGIRDEIWPIIGGKFEGVGIRGDVVPGGGDFPVTRPDGMTIIDALYRLKTDDGVTILIHNKGFYYPGGPEDFGTARLVPVFTAPAGKYDWLNKSIFLSTLSDAPEHMQVAEGPNENDRLIQVHRVF